MKMQIYLYARKVGWSDELEITAHSTKFENGDYPGVLFAETEIEVLEPIRADVITGQVKVLRVQQQELRAKCEVDVQKIEQQIGELLAIEDKSEAAKEGAE